MYTKRVTVIDLGKYVRKLNKMGYTVWRISVETGVAQATLWKLVRDKDYVPSGRAVRDKILSYYEEVTNAPAR